MSEPLKLKQWVNNIKLQNKLVIIYVVTGLLPLIILLYLRMDRCAQYLWTGMSVQWKVH